MWLYLLLLIFPLLTFGQAPQLNISSTASSPTNTNPIPVTINYNQLIDGLHVDKLEPFNATVADFKFAYPSKAILEDSLVDATVICVSPLRNVFVVDQGASLIKKVVPEGDIIAEWDITATGNVIGITADKDENVYIITDNNEVFMYDPNGNAVLWDLSFESASDIAVTPDGMVYILDGGGGVLTQHDPSLDGLETGYWDIPFCTFLEVGGPNGYIYLADDSSNTIYIVDPANSYSVKTLDGSYGAINDLTIDGFGYIYTLDKGSFKLLKIDTNGVIVESISPSNPFKNPQAVCVANDGRIYASDTPEPFSAYIDLLTPEATLNVYPDADGSVGFVIPESTASNLAGEVNPETIFSIEFDQTAPTYVIEFPNGEATNATPIPAKIIFSEEVIGFDESDFYFYGANATIETGSLVEVIANKEYTFNISPNSGIVDEYIDIEIDGEVIDITDMAGNDLIWDYFYTYYDIVKPQPSFNSNEVSPTSNSSIPLEFLLDEDLIGFTLSDLVTTNATIDSVEYLGEGPYMLNLNILADGVATVSLPANTRADWAGNGNEAAIFSVVGDFTGPVATFSSSTSLTNSSASITIDFDEAVVGFDSTDLATINATVSNFQQVSVKSFTADIYPTVTASDSIMKVWIEPSALSDSLFNDNILSDTLTINYDITGPSYTIEFPNGEATNISPIPAKITFSEDVIGFDESDFYFYGANATIEAGSLAEVTANKEYTFNILPNAGVVEEYIDMEIDGETGNITDLAGNIVNIDYFYTFYDIIKPQPIFNSNELSPTSNSSFLIELAFNEYFENFTLADLITTNATIDSLDYNGEGLYTLTMNILSDGMASVTVPADIHYDPAGNSNAEATFSIVGDFTGPVATLQASKNITNDILTPVPFSIDFDDNVTGFTIADISVSNATISNFQQLTPSSYSADLLPITEGNMEAWIEAGALTDSLGNGNTLSDTVMVVYDITGPIVRSEVLPANKIYQAGETLSITVNFNEAIQVSGSPSLALGFNNLQGSGTWEASYQSASDSSITFAYTVQARDEDKDGITLPLPMMLNGGSITDIVGNAATLDLANNGNTSGILVDAFANKPVARTYNIIEDSTLEVSIEKDPNDDANVTHFKVSNITNGVLYQPDSITIIPAGTFIPAENPIVFIPTLAFFGTASFDVQSSISADDTGIADIASTITFNVLEANDPPILETVISDIVMPYNAADSSIVFSDYFYDEEGATLSYTIDGTGSSVTYSLTGDQLSFSIQDIGTTVISVVATDDLGAQAAASFSIIVEPALLTVSTDTLSRPYNTANPTFNLYFSGFKVGENKTVLATLPTVSTTATLSSNVGIYPVTISGGNDSHYTFNYINSTLEVVKQTQSISFTPIEDIDLLVKPEFSLQAEATSGLPVSFEVLEGNATINGGLVSLYDTGKVTIAAYQIGDLNFEAAASVNVSFYVTESEYNVYAVTSIYVKATEADLSLGSGNQLLVQLPADRLDVLKSILDFDMTLEDSTAVPEWLTLSTDSSQVIIDRDISGISNDDLSLLIRVTGEERIIELHFLIPSEIFAYAPSNRIVLGVDDEFKSNIKLYPNPAVDIINLEGNFSTGSQLSIFDATGRLVLVQSLEGLQQTITVAQLPNGLYHLMIKTDKGVSALQLLKR
ncbi:Ig-like domain-containing protein [Limibacter armeniacum]|uniref:Ig-like domain-containing protein n=1 Tax=Limibacter armeniacum TaxID=466084 RepID=UPI002FE60BB0